MRSLHTFVWPLSGLFLHDTKRVRVLVMYNDAILLQRTSFGSQKWSLPGGGVKKKEAPVDAVIRETKEETNISLSKQSIHFLGQRSVPTRKNWPVVNLLFYKSQLNHPQEAAIIRPLEILSVQWFKISELPENRSKTVNLSLEMLQSHKSNSSL